VRGSDYPGNSQVASSGLSVKATDGQIHAISPKVHLEASEVILAEFRPDLSKYRVKNVVMILANGTVALSLLHTLDDRIAVVAFICIVAVLGFKAVAKAKTVAALEWYLTNLRILSNDGQAIPLLEIKSARSWHNVNVFSVDGDVLRLIYLAQPAAAASKIRAAPVN